MLCLTHHERKVLLAIGFFILCASFLRYYSTSHYRDEKFPVTRDAQKLPISVNINTATFSQLQALPGVGARIAERIVAYRSAHGPFNDKESLAEVKGIGEKKIKRMEKCITF